MQVYSFPHREKPSKRKFNHINCYNLDSALWYLSNYCSKQMTLCEFWGNPS